VDLNPAAGPPRIELHVETLVCTGLPGIGSAHADRIEQAFTRELTRLLRDRPPCDAIGDRDDPAVPPTIRAPRSAHGLGVDLARVVHARLTAAPDMNEGA
jgi:hypothetical protein